MPAGGQPRSRPDRTKLRQVQAELTASRIYDAIRDPLPGGYDLTHWRAFYRHIFQDLYDWAGELRLVSIGRGRLFGLPQHLEADADELFSWLVRSEHLCGRDRDTFVDDLTELFADLNALHPFRDGNGRPSGRSSGSWRRMRGTRSNGRRWTPPRTSPRPGPRTRATTTRCVRCSTASCTAADVPGFGHDTVAS